MSADLGDNYISGLFDNVKDPMTHATYADKFMKASEAPGVVHEKTNSIQTSAYIHIYMCMSAYIHIRHTGQHTASHTHPNTYIYNAQVHETTPEILRPFAGHYDRSLKLKDWTDKTQDHLKKAMRSPLLDPLFRLSFQDR
jgi:hypothetical protein